MSRKHNSTRTTTQTREFYLPKSDYPDVIEARIAAVMKAEQAFSRSHNRRDVLVDCNIISETEFGWQIETRTRMI